VLNGENYIVINYKANSIVKSIWVTVGSARSLLLAAPQELERSITESCNSGRKHRRCLRAEARLATCLEPGTIRTRHANAQMFRALA